MANERYVRWDATVTPHRIHDRYDVGGEFSVSAPTERDARAEAVRASHRAAGIPSWRPWMRETWPHSSVKRHRLTEAEELQLGHKR